jgi:hypothetical protein
VIEEDYTLRKIVENQELELKYQPGFGSWTYHIRIPGTAAIKGTWGSMKVIGKIDDYVVNGINLAPRKDEDKIISINKDIRNSINKNGGDLVKVTLYLLDWYDTEEEISNVFESLSKTNI